MSHEFIIRASCFTGVLVVMAVWERFAARRELKASKRRRWFGNLGLVLLDTLVVRLLFPAAAVGVAVAAENFGWGLFHQLNLPHWLEILASLILLDFVIYLQHVLFHAVPALWRLHMVHHADVDFDVTTGIRFHPIEITLSMALKMGVVAALGPPVVAVLIFEILLNATAMFNHANIHIPPKVDRFLRWIVVTPDMHRVHHSVGREEHDRNFGFNLPWWDRLLGTYLDQPAEGHLGMRIGLRSFRSPNWQSLPRLLAMPFARPELEREKPNGV